MKIKFMSILFFVTGLWAQDVVFWEPEIPVPGGDITIYYNVVEGTLPNNSNPVYIHLGYNGWQNTNDYAMTLAPDVGDEWWQYTYSIPTNAETIDFVFTDLEGNWDNNGGHGIDWHISLNYYWTPFHPGPEEVVSIVLNNVDQGGEISWTVDAGQGHVLPIDSYRPTGSYLESDLLFTPLQSLGGSALGIDLGPFLEGTQVVHSIKFRIRWDDGTWDVGTNGQIMYYDIYIDYDYSPGDPYVFFISPTPAENANVAGDVTIALTGDAAYVDFWANGEFIGTDNSSTFSATWTPDDYDFGQASLTAIAYGSGGQVTYLFRNVFVLPEVTVEPAPAGVTDGVNINGNTVTLTLYAPYKNFVAIKGSWNPEFQNGELMKLSGDTLWWYQTELDNGEYEYQYNVDGEKIIADPWSKDVTWTDPSGQWESGFYEHAKTVFSVGADPYVWNDDGFVRPTQSEVIVYELHVGDFASDGDIHGTFQDVINKLEEGYFNDLGINTIELLPVNEFEGGYSWGYNPTFYMAPESVYGTPNQLKELVDLAHQNGIAVLMDVVFNHMWGSAPLFLLYQPLGSFDYEDHDYDHCPYFHNQESQWGYKLEHWHESNGRPYRAWKYVSETLLTWINDYHIDGFRFDHTAGMGWGGDSNGASYYADMLDDIDPSLILIAEEDNAYQINSTDFDACWDFTYFHVMFDNLMELSSNMYNVQGQLQWWTQSYNEHTGPVNYVESHDEPRIIYEATHYQGMTSTEAGLKSKLGAATLLTGTGTPMLYHGQEFGQNGYSRDPSGYIIPQPLQWGNLDNSFGSNLFSYYKRLIWLRNNWEVIRGPNLEIIYLNNTQDVIGMKREDSSLGQTVYTIMNFSSSDQTIEDMPFPYAGTWYEYTEDTQLVTESGSYSNYNIPASTARIYTNYKNWEDLSTQESEHPIPTEFSLKQNYPNPFNPVTTLEYSITKLGDVSLTIFDLNGRLVEILVNETVSPGNYTVKWDASNHASGVYFAKIMQSNQTQIKKMMLIK